MQRLIIVCVISYFIVHHNADTVTINTELGKIRGTMNKSSWSPTTIMYEFKGIPYSTPMIDDLRFRPSILNTSTYNGTLDATTFGFICPQPPTYTDQPQNEDCLFLNIWTTKSNVDNANNKLVPVMVFIHGGAFYVGSGSDPQYNGSNLMGEYGAEFVYVSINYRLGALGFLQNEAIYNEDANWPSYGGLNGIYDQIVALQWINKYISSFGGDKSQITIFGQSAGGISVCTLLISTFGKHLFQRAIIESGSCIGGWDFVNTSTALNNCNQELETAGYPINNLTYLRSIPAMEFITNVGGYRGVDGLILTDVTENIFSDENTELNANEIIVGFNSLDGLWSWPYFMGPDIPTTDIQYKLFIAFFISNTTQQNEIYNIYYPPSAFSSYPPNINTYNNYQIATATMNCDVCVICPSLQIAQQLLVNKLSPKVYVYQFLGPGMNNIYYAPHGSELLFVFDYDNKTLEEAYLLPWDQNLSNSMLSAWSNFGKYGVPNITSQNVNIVWNEFSKNNENAILFKGGNGIENVANFNENYRNNVCQFWYNEVGVDRMKRLCRA